MPLTPNQSKAFITMTKLYKTYQSLMLKADCCLGKNYIARKFLEDKKYIEFDLCELCRENVERITSQGEISSFISIILRKQLLNFLRVPLEFLFIFMFEESISSMIF